MRRDTEITDVATLAVMNDIPQLVAVNDSIRILQSVRRIAQCVEHHSKRLAVTHNITSPQLVALLAIAQTGPSTLKAIGRAIQLSPSTVVGIVDRLEEKGLVSRQRDTRDRRNVFVAVTAAGQTVLANAPPALPNGFSSALGGLSEADRQALVVTLEQFATLLEAKIPVEPA
ncbi:MarR family transcriptional regulator [Oxalicibacterium flavum]|uniref:MarR family transcriptional regulator n=2 Tax=Oxalicibacterium flavum TaxID=179467 RepID=A0A8J2ULB4_9BURK|nr:MarR family transcriptional regulator [Oxalicibacterium flavum]